MRWSIDVRNSSLDPPDSNEFRGTVTYMSSTTYRTNALAEAVAMRDAARTAYNAKPSRDNAEELEFWGNKVAFLVNDKGWA